MNVLMVTSSYPKFPGDVTAPFIEEIVRALLARGHAVDVVLPHHPELRRSRGYPARFFPYRYAPLASWCVWGYAASLKSDVRVRKAAYLLAPLVAVALRRELSARFHERRYDVVHAHWIVPNAALIADIVARRRTPLVISLHGSDVFLAERQLIARVLARRALRTADAVTACSEDLRERALRLGSPGERTRTIPYGVDVQSFSHSLETTAVRERLAVPIGALLILGVGRLVEKKGFRTLVEAASLVEGIHVVIAGEGDLRAELEAQARARKAPVTFCGALDRARVRAAFAAADVVVVPSIVDHAGNVDGLPNTLLEALAAARPVVASRVGGIPDVVQDGRNGRLVPPGDAPALAAVLSELVRSAEARKHLAAEARRSVAARLSWEAAARAFEECYAQAAALEAR